MQCSAILILVCIIGKGQVHVAGELKWVVSNTEIEGDKIEMSTAEYLNLNYLHLNC